MVAQGPRCDSNGCYKTPTNTLLNRRASSLLFYLSLTRPLQHALVDRHHARKDTDQPISFENSDESDVLDRVSGFVDFPHTNASPDTEFKAAQIAVCT